MFNVDFNLLVWQLLPVRVRQVVHYAWLKVLVSGVKYVYTSLFVPNRTANLYDLSINGQVCKLEKVLNDTFDNVARGIFISEPVYIDPLMIYRRSELKPVYLARRSELPVGAYTAPQYLYRRSECYTGGGVQFIVNVPVAVVFDTARMRALIDTYKLVSKTNYTIVTF